MGYYSGVDTGFKPEGGREEGGGLDLLGTKSLEVGKNKILLTWKTKKGSKWTTKGLKQYF